MRRRSIKFCNHSEIFTTIAKITSGIFAIIAKFRYDSENMYDPPLTDKTVHSEVSKKKKKVVVFFLLLLYFIYIYIYINCIFYIYFYYFIFKKIVSQTKKIVLFIYLFYFIIFNFILKKNFA